MSSLLRGMLEKTAEYFFYFTQSFYFSFGYFPCDNSGKARLCS